MTTLSKPNNHSQQITAEQNITLFDCTPPPRQLNSPPALPRPTSPANSLSHPGVCVDVERRRVHLELGGVLVDADTHVGQPVPQVVALGIAAVVGQTWQ